MAQFDDVINALISKDKEQFESALQEHMNALTRQKLSENVYTDIDTAVITDIITSATTFGGDCDYLDDGVFEATFKDRDAVLDFTDFLDNDDRVYSYDVFALETIDGITSEIEVDFEDITDDTNYEFVVVVYLTEESALYGVEYEDDLELNEVKRRIKVNAMGKKRIKMQCQKGFKWSGTACIKISGAELATNRIAKRKMVISKRSQGASLKIRTLRKTRKANRFRKAFGLKRENVGVDNIATADMPFGKRLNENVVAKYAIKSAKPNGRYGKHDYIKVTQNGDLYTAFIALDSVGGEKVGNKEQVGKWLKTRLQTMGGNTRKVKVLDGTDVLSLGDYDIIVEDTLNEERLSSANSAMLRLKAPNLLKVIADIAYKADHYTMTTKGKSDFEFTAYHSDWKDVLIVRKNESGDFTVTETKTDFSGNTPNALAPTKKPFTASEKDVKAMLTELESKMKHTSNKAFSEMKGK